MKMDVLFWETVWEVMVETSGSSTKIPVSFNLRVLRMQFWLRSVGVIWGWRFWEMSVHTSSGGWSQPVVYNWLDLPPRVIWSIHSLATWTRVMTGSWGAVWPSSTPVLPHTFVWLAGALEVTLAYSMWTRTGGWPYSQCGITVNTK